MMLDPSDLELDLAETKPMPKLRREALEPLQSLLQSTAELRSPTAWQVAGRCAVAVTTALRARAVMIHHHDRRTREVRVIGVDGPNAGDVLGSGDDADADLIAATVLANEKPMTIHLDGDLPGVLPRRIALVGASRSIIAVPVIADEGCVAIIELIDVDERRAGTVTEACEVVANLLLRVLSPPAG